MDLRWTMQKPASAFFAYVLLGGSFLTVDDVRAVPSAKI
jgi:hypothetical protein